MNRKRMETVMLTSVIAVVLTVTAFFTWPNYAEAFELSNESRLLEQKIGHLEDVEADLERRSEELVRLHERQAHACRLVPDRPDVADLMQHLSIGVDGETVLDQTFTVRGRGDRAGDARFEILPLVVELETTFDNIFDVIRRVERLERLVRVTSISMNCRDVDFKNKRPTVRAAIGMDVVYEDGEAGGQ
ncbi:MAG: type 4a pilus biogenesis protein PilO [Planctomycetota bacterium]|nr:type 4a pilus biogenesis protein PilO [Planctomycetota bacterium]